MMVGQGLLLMMILALAHRRRLARGHEPGTAVLGGENKMNRNEMQELTQQRKIFSPGGQSTESYRLREYEHKTQTKTRGPKTR